jgi:3',5'-cyclic AMP phosphodiesterase CpdA
MNVSELTRRQFLAGAAAGAALIAEGPAFAESLRMGLDAWTEQPETSARVQVKDPANFKVLQLTDLHFFCQEHRPETDKLTCDNLPRYVEHFQPDLLLVTGDLWHDNDDSRGEEFMRFGVEQISKLGVPWLFTWGNHDRLDDYAAGHKHITEAPHSLYRGGPNGGNYVVEAVDASSKALWDFVCLNTHDLGMQQAQRDWLARYRDARGDQSAAHAFGVFHIPITQYATIWDNGAASGVKLEEVVNEQEDGSSLEVLKSLGHLRACFCGHDHINDYAGKIDGIDLVYGRATGHGGYGATRIPKGAKLITINCETGAYDWKSVYADGSSWKETAGVRIDEYKATEWAEKDTA